MTGEANHYLIPVPVVRRVATGIYVKCLTVSRDISCILHRNIDQTPAVGYIISKRAVQSFEERLLSRSGSDAADNSFTARPKIRVIETLRSKAIFY